MDAAQAQVIDRLTESLEELTKLYRQLFEVVRLERELLISANLPELEKNNEIKETLIMKVRLADQLRVKRAEDAARAVNADVHNPRLLEIAKRVFGPVGARLRTMHGELEKLLTQISEMNRGNEEYTQSALRTLGGAMNEIKETLTGKKTYERKGTYKLGPETTGNFVSKEA